MDKENKNEKGMVLVTVIIFGAIIIMLGVALLSTGIMEVKSGNYFEKKTQAYYVAKAGADIVAKKIIDGAEVKTYDGTIDGNNTYHVTAIKSGNQITLNSEGTSSGVKDEVQLLIKENIQSNGSDTLETDMAVFATDSFKIASGTVEGGIGTNALGENKVIITNSGDINIGSIYLRNGAPDNVISKPVERTVQIGRIPSERIYRVPNMPEIPEGSSSENLIITWYPVIEKINMTEKIVFYNSFDFRGPPLEIDVGDQDRAIVVEKFIMSGSSNIKIKGTGTLSIYIKDTFNISGSTSINWSESNEPGKLKVYYYNNNKPITFSGGIKFCGVFQSDLAPITITSGTSNIFRGTIISATNKIDISGGTHTYTNVLYAPNAIVDIHNGGHFKGSLIGKNVTISGRSSVVYNNPGVITIPVVGGSGSSVTYEKINYE